MFVRVDNMTEARRLSEAVSLCDCQIDAVTVAGVGNAKNFLDIINLDIRNDIELKFHCADKDLLKYETIVLDRY